MNKNIDNTLGHGVLPKKCYSLNLHLISEGYLFEQVYIYAENRNKAKSSYMSEILHQGYLYHNGDELTYLNLPLIRNKDHDKVIYDGKLIDKSKIRGLEKAKEKKAELQRILSDNTITHCYIYKGSYYCPNKSGYTSYKSKAGV